ncbi:MAG: amidase family protein [Lawsonella clevelandensis]
MKVGVIKEFLTDEGCQPGVAESFQKAVETLKGLGQKSWRYRAPTSRMRWLLITSFCRLRSRPISRVSTVCATACGWVMTGTDSAEEVMSLTRAAGFGKEVKRRIIIGTYALSAGYYDAYYGQAQKVRTLIAQDFQKAYEKVDVLVSPTTPQTAFKLGERVDDPVSMYPL